LTAAIKVSALAIAPLYVCHLRSTRVWCTGSRDHRVLPAHPAV